MCSFKSKIICYDVLVKFSQIIRFTVCNLYRWLFKMGYTSQILSKCLICFVICDPTEAQTDGRPPAASGLCPTHDKTVSMRDPEPLC